jgi:hypothetical protein
MLQTQNNLHTFCRKEHTGCEESTLVNTKRALGLGVGSPFKAGIGSGYSKSPRYIPIFMGGNVIIEFRGRARVQCQRGFIVET